MVSESVVSVPVGVKLIATWYFIGAVIFFLLVSLFLGLADGVSVASSTTSVLAATGDAGVNDFTDSAGSLAYDTSNIRGFNSDAFTSDVSSQVGQNLATGLLTGLIGSLPGVIVFVILAVVCLLFSILQFFVGLGLWTGRSWARVVAIIFSLLGVLGSALYLFLGLFVGAFWSSGFLLIVHALIAGYLLFNKRVSESFAS